MTNKKWILLFLFCAGLIILLLPDHGNSVIVLNEKHGPSLLDLVGLSLMLISWFLSCIVVVKKWREIRLKAGTRVFRLLILVYISSITGIALSLMFSSDLILWPCVVIAGFINILFVIHAFNEEM